MKAIQASTNIYTLVSKDDAPSPTANLAMLSWLEGHWRGVAFDGVGEEIWGPAFGASMMGSFKLVVDNQVKFYELLTIVEVDNSIVMRIKHFGPELKGWEAKDESVDFRFINATDSKVYFDGLTFEQIEKNHIKVYVLLKRGAKLEEVLFDYRRV